MQNDLTVYVRDEKSIPTGVVVFEKTGIMPNGVEVIAMGWSKAYKDDTFRKKFGREIASKRAIKTKDWVNNNLTVAHSLDMVNDANRYMPTDDSSSVSHIKFINIPFIIKQNFSHYVEIAKDSFRINGYALFVIPVIEKYVDLANPMKYAIANNRQLVDTSYSNTTSKTRYFTLKA